MKGKGKGSNAKIIDVGQGSLLHWLVELNRIECYDTNQYIVALATIKTKRIPYPSQKNGLIE